MSNEEKYSDAIRYIRDKIDQMLSLMGTLPLRPEELDDDTLIALDPIGIVVNSFEQVLEHLKETNHQLAISQSEIRTIFNSVQVAIIVVKPDWTVEEVNSEAQEYFFDNRSTEQIVGSPLSVVCNCGGDVEKTLLENPQMVGEYCDGKHCFRVTASPVYGESGKIEKTVFLYSDVSAMQSALEKLKIYARVFDNTAEGILITDPETRIINANRAFTEITGYALEELQGSKPDILKSGMHDDEFYQKMWGDLEKKGHWRGEIFDRCKDGSLSPLWQTISTIRDEQGGVSNYISIINDISSLKETQSRLDYLAHHDPLTDLPNRLLLYDRLSHSIRRSLRDGSSTAILFIDLDRFKTINDSLGHHVGDLLLQLVGKRLVALVRGSDSVARLGGDEFVILLEEVGSSDDAAHLAHKVIDALSEPFDVAGHELHIGCSIGISVTPSDGEDAGTLLKNADTAMYKVKESGRDGYHIYSTELSDMAEERLRIEGALRKVVLGRKFFLLFQPIIDASSDKATAAEALVRWDCPELGDVSPARFIPVAEESKLIIPIGQQVLEMALEQLVAWREQGLEMDYLSVNVSGPQLYHKGFASGLITMMQEKQIQGEKIQLEITESVLMDDVERCVHQLNKLRGYGIRIAIDDFGTGYSSLSYLRSLPLDIIKVDRSFVSDIPADKNDCAIATAVVSLAQALELESVAEGIETAKQREFMRELGCDRFQGFLFSRPLSADDFAEYWRANSE